MPIDPNTTGTSVSGPRPPGATAPPSEPPPLPVLRFGLRQLFWLLTVVCLVLAGVVAAPTPGIAPLAVLLAALVVAFHVVGTALGSRLREHANERITWEAAQQRAAGNVQRAGARAATRRSSWHERGQPMRWRWWLIGAGAAVGGGGGGVLFLSVDRLATSLAGIVLGAMSMAVVGAWFAFLGSNFWVMLRRGWREAVADERDGKARRNAVE